MAFQRFHLSLRKPLHYQHGCLSFLATIVCCEVNQDNEHQNQGLAFFEATKKRRTILNKATLNK
jgi:hypothetical protein